MLDLTLDELKLVAKSRGIKGFTSMYKERLLSALSKPKLIENNFVNERLKRIREDLKVIRKNLYEIERNKILSTQKIKEIEKSLSRLKKYHDYDDAEYTGIRHEGNLFNEIAFNQSTNEDCYKTIKTKSAFSGNYIEYESNGDKDKKLNNVSIWSGSI